MTTVSRERRRLHLLEAERLRKLRQRAARLFRLLRRKRIFDPAPQARHPMTLLVATAMGVSGLGVLVGGPIAPSTAGSLSPQALSAWAALCVLAWVTCVYAATQRAVIWSLTLERIAMLALASACAIYVAAAVLTLGRQSVITPILVQVFIVIACLIQASKVTTQLWHLRSQQQQQQQQGSSDGA